MNEENSLLTGAVRPALLRYALPIILSMVATQFYAVADTMIIGLRLDADALAAVSNASTVLMIFLFISGGMELGGGLLVAAGLLGLVLLGVSSWLPAKTEPTAEAAPQATAASAYEADLETRLQSLISNLAGAGETRVMVTLQCGEESIYAADTETSADGTAASKHVIAGGTGLVETIQTPQVLGVAVLCRGGEDPAVQSRITALVQALTGVGANHVTVAALGEPTPHP